MKLAVFTFTILVLLITENFSQEQLNQKHTEKHPSINIINPVDNFYFTYDEFEFIRALNHKKMQIINENNEGDLWLRTKLTFKSGLISYNEKVGLSDDVLDPLYRQYIESQKFNPVRYVLGLAQTAAVGYLAYKHIKKYGFFK